MRRAQILLIALLLAGCGVLDTSADELSFNYIATNKPGYIDQVVEIHNDGLTAAAPTLRFTPLDMSGHPLRDVRVTAVYGSDFGDQVVVPDLMAYDILRFTGREADDVADVKVTVVKTHAVKFPHVKHLVKLARLDDTGRVVGPDRPFSATRVTNPNTRPVRIRVMLISFNEARSGEPETVADTLEVGGLIELAPGAGKTLQLEEPADPSTEIKAYFSR